MSRLCIQFKLSELVFIIFFLFFTFLASKRQSNNVRIRFILVIGYLPLVAQGKTSNRGFSAEDPIGTNIIICFEIHDQIGFVYERRR